MIHRISYFLGGIFSWLKAIQRLSSEDHTHLADFFSPKVTSRGFPSCLADLFTLLRRFTVFPSYFPSLWMNSSVKEFDHSIFDLLIFLIFWSFRSLKNIDRDRIDKSNRSHQSLKKINESIRSFSRLNRSFNPSITKNDCFDRKTSDRIPNPTIYLARFYRNIEQAYRSIPLMYNLYMVLRVHGKQVR